MLNTVSDSISIFTTNHISLSFAGEQKPAQGRCCVGLFLSLNRVNVDRKLITPHFC